jgi:hypothetical protein
MNVIELKEIKYSFFVLQLPSFLVLQICILDFKSNFERKY